MFIPFQWVVELPHRIGKVPVRKLGEKDTMITNLQDKQPFPPDICDKVSTFYRIHWRRIRDSFPKSIATLPTEKPGGRHSAV